MLLLKDTDYPWKQFSAVGSESAAIRAWGHSLSGSRLIPGRWMLRMQRVQSLQEPVSGVGHTVCLIQQFYVSFTKNHFFLMSFQLPQGTRALSPQAFTPLPCFTARLPHLLPVATSEQLCSQMLFLPLLSSLHHWHAPTPALEAMLPRTPEARLAPGCAHSAVVFALGSRPGLFLARLQQGQTRLPTVHIHHAKSTSLQTRSLQNGYFCAGKEIPGAHQLLPNSACLRAPRAA